MNCREITIKISEIKTKKVEFDSVVKTDIPRALILKKELQLSINELKEILEILNPVFKIEGKEFPVFKLEIGGKTAQELENELVAKSFTISGLAKDMFKSLDFVTSPTVEQINLVRLKVSDLGFRIDTTIGEIYAKAQKLGLELCPAEVGPYQRLKDTDQPMGDIYSIAMRQIAEPGGSPRVFDLIHNDGGFYLNKHWAWSGRKWNVDDVLMFKVPHSKPDGDE